MAVTRWLIFALVLACSPRVTRAPVPLHPAIDQRYWAEEHADLAQQPVAQRVRTAPRILIDYLVLDNIANGFPERPTAAPGDERFQLDVRNAMTDLPPAILEAVSPVLAGVFIARELGGTAYTEYIYDQAGKPAAAFIVLDYDALMRTANEWASWKENTPFRPDSVHQIHVVIEEPEHDTRQNAIQYILLHEFGHVLSVVFDAHPDWRGQKQDPAAFSFSKISWTLSQDAYHVSNEAHGFPLRKSIRYYWGALLNYEDAPHAYGQAASNGFVTLYSATSPYDDFAETFAYFVHAELQKKPFRVELQAQGKKIWEYTPMLGQSSLALKLAQLRRRFDAALR